MSGHNCGICDLVAQAQPEQSVYLDDLWFAGVMGAAPIPGWIVLALRRHAEGPMQMNPAEAASFGPLLVSVTQAIKDATDAERVYALSWGENHAHFHIMLCARDATVPPDHRHVGFWTHRDEYVNPPAAQATAARVREELLKQTKLTEEVA